MFDIIFVDCVLIGMFLVDLYGVFVIGTGLGRLFSWLVNDDDRDDEDWYDDEDDGDCDCDGDDEEGDEGGDNSELDAQLQKELNEVVEFIKNLSEEALNKLSDEARKFLEGLDEDLLNRLQELVTGEDRFDPVR